MENIYNFLIPKLLPKVQCSASSMDNYEVSNLIDENDLVRSRGFISFSSIKPPVNVDFELLCPVNIHYILIDATVGTQRSSGIEILTKSSSDIFTSITKMFFEQNKVMFCNSRLFSNEKPPSNYDENTGLHFFKSSTFRAFLSATTVRIRILKTDRSVPCLGRVEIWGRPSKTCSEVTRNTINLIVHKGKFVTQPQYQKNYAEEVEREKFDIPEEFKDALTFDIMTIPLTLPSGSTIDQSTLEKFVENEATCGRHPSDPFTGLKFTSTRKPMLNVALKSRIDMFLLSNSHREETFTLKRTVGQVRSNSAPVCHKNIDQTATHFKRKRYEGTNDLDELIKKVRGDSKFVCYTEDEAVGQCLENKCASCNIDNNLYILPCKHLFCRNCLVEVYNSLKCDLCNARFEKNGVLKFHFAG